MATAQELEIRRELGCELIEAARDNAPPMFTECDYFSSVERPPLEFDQAPAAKSPAGRGFER